MSVVYSLCCVHSFFAVCPPFAMCLSFAVCMSFAVCFAFFRVFRDCRVHFHLLCISLFRVPLRGDTRQSSSFAVCLWHIAHGKGPVYNLSSTQVGYTWLLCHMVTLPCVYTRHPCFF